MDPSKKALLLHALPLLTPLLNLGAPAPGPIHRSSRSGPSKQSLKRKRKRKHQRRHR